MIFLCVPIHVPTEKIEYARVIVHADLDTLVFIQVQSDSHTESGRFVPSYIIPDITNVRRLIPAPAIFLFLPMSSLCASHNLPPDPCLFYPPRNNPLQGGKNRSPIPPR